VEDADQPVAVKEGYGELRHHAREQRDVARVLRDVSHEDGLAPDRGRAHDAFAGPDAEAPRHLVRVAFDEGGDEVARGRGQEDVEDLVADDLPELLRDRGQELVGVEHRVDLADDRQEIREQLPGERRTLSELAGAGHDPPFYHATRGRPVGAVYTGLAMSPLKLPLEIEDIKAILPHRHPFLLVDGILESEEDRRIGGEKNVSSDERSSIGGRGGVPALLASTPPEAMPRAGAVPTLAKPETRSRLIYFMG